MDEIEKLESFAKGHKKWVSYLHRTAQPSALAIFRSWGSSTGAGRIRLTQRKYRESG